MPDSDDSGSGSSGSSGGASLHYALAVFYLLFAVFMIIVAWIIPNIGLAASVTFTLLGSVIFIASIVQLVYVSQLATSICSQSAATI